MEPSFESKRKLELSDYTSKESIPESVKYSFHRESDDKLEAMKELYEQRIESITAFAHKFYEVAKTDDVLSAMQGNYVSEKFINLRMRELFEETMLKECEFTIQNLQNELSNQKLLISRQDQDKIKQQHQIKSLEEALKNEEFQNSKLEREVYENKNKINCMRIEFEEAIKRRDKELSMKLDDIKGNYQKDEQGKKEKLLQEVENLKYQLDKERNRVKIIEDDNKMLKKDLECSLRYEDEARNYQKIIEENKRLKDNCSKYEENKEEYEKKASNFEKHLKSIVAAEQKASTEALTTLQHKYKSRTKAFKKKIIDQKQTIESLDQQLKSYKQGIEDYKKNIEKRALGSQDDLKRVKDEWEKRCSELQLEYQRKEAELQTKQQLQLVALQGQYQNLLDERVQELQREMASSRAKNKEIELRVAVEEKLKDYVPRCDYEELIKEREKLIKTCEKFTSQTASFEKEFEKVLKERAILEKTIEFERSKIKELEERDDEKKKRLQLEDKLVIINNSLQQYRDLLTEKEEEIEELNKKSQDMRTNIATLEFELENEKNKSKTMKNDIQQLKNELTLTETTKRELENNMIITQSQLDIENRRKKTEGIEKFEEELAKHMETKTKLIQAEGKWMQLQREHDESEKKIKEYKENIKNNENELSKLKKKVLEYDSEINVERISSQDLQKKLEKFARGNFSKNENYQKAKTKIQTLKILIKSLKSNFIEELQEVKKDNSSSIQDLLFRFIDSNNYMRKQLEIRYQAINEEMNEDWVKKMQGIEENINQKAVKIDLQYQEKLNSQEKYIEALKNSTLVLKKDQKSAIEEIEKYKKKITELQEKISSTEKENKGLEISLKKNSSAFDALQVEIKKETLKLSHSHEASLEKQRKELEKKHAAELHEFTEKFKDKDSQGENYIREKLKEIEQLKEEEVFQIKKRYQELLDNAYNDVQNEKEKSSRMKQKLISLEEEIQILKQEHIKITSEFEERVKFLDKHSKMEIEVLNSQLQQSETKDTKISKFEAEINEKNEEIMSLRKEREKIRSKLRDLEEKIEIQNKNFYTQLSMKEKEIDSLKNVVSRSYSESTVVKRAYELDKETQEITKQIRKNPQVKNSGYSYSSEISKPI